MKFIFIILTLFSSINLYAIDTFNNTFPILVTKNNDRTYVCSSVAISKRVLLTAAHCLDNAKNVLVVKENQLLPDNTFLEIVGYQNSELYDRESSYFLSDIGRITLQEDLDDRIHIHPIGNVQENTGYLQRVGFGLRDNMNQKYLTEKSHHFKLNEGFITVQDNESVPGDSGGAIFQIIGDNATLVSIHSSKEGDKTLNPTIVDSMELISQ